MCAPLLFFHIHSLGLLLCRCSLVILAGQDGIQDNSENGCDGQGGQGNGGPANGEGQAVGEAEATDQNDRRDDEVSRLREVDVVFNDIPDTDGGNHTVEDEGNAADDGRRQGTDDFGELGRKGKDDGIYCRNPDDPGVIDLGELKDACVLAICRIGRTADSSGHGRCQAVADQSPVQARVLDEIVPGRGGNSTDISDMLHHGSQGNRSHDEDGRQVELAQLERLNRHIFRTGDFSEIQDGAAVGVRHAGRIEDQGENIGNHDTHQDGDDLEHALAPDIEDDDDREGNQGQEPVRRSIVHCGRRQGKADADDDGAGDDGWQETHDPADAHQLDDQGQDQVHEAGHDDAAAGIGKLLSHGHILVDARIKGSDGRKAPEEGEGRAEEGRDLSLRNKMKEKGSGSGTKQCDLDGKSFSFEVIIHQYGN